jgi:hypothetical protein
VEKGYSKKLTVNCRVDWKQMMIISIETLIYQSQLTAESLLLEGKCPYSVAQKKRKKINQTIKAVQVQLIE